MVQKFSSLQLPIDRHPRLAQLFGQIVARWANVDDFLAVILGFMLDADVSKGETILYSLGNFKSRLDIVRNVATDHLSDVALKARLLTALKHIERLSRTRNAYIHNLSAGSKEGMIHVQRRPGAKQRLAHLPLKETDLSQHMSAVEQAIGELFMVRQSFMDGRHAQRSSPHRPS